MTSMLHWIWKSAKFKRSIESNARFILFVIFFTMRYTNTVLNASTAPIMNIDSFMLMFPIKFAAHASKCAMG